MNGGKNFFWVSYSDLMTSMFFIMLVLYIVTFAILQQQLGKAQADAAKLQEIENVEKALQSIDTNYFDFDDVNKRYKLNVNVNFPSNSSNINDISIDTRRELQKAGKSLYKKISSVIDTNNKIDYFLIIEGNTQRSNNNWINFPDDGYKKSYERALSLYNFWKKKGIDFRDIGTQCEVILAGSGFGGQCRYVGKQEYLNKRFIVQPIKRHCP